MGNLTALQIKAIPLGPQPKKYTDGGGLYLYVNKVGKYWRYDYRFLKKRKTLSLGVYPRVSLKDAHKKHQAAKDILEVGADPGLTKQERQRLNVKKDREFFGPLALEWLAIQKTKWSEATYKKEAPRIENHIMPYLKNRPVKDITTPEVLALIKKIEETKSGDTPKRVKNLMARIFRYARIQGLIIYNPAGDLSEALRKPEVGGFPFIEDKKEFSLLLKKIDTYGGHFIIRAALKLQYYTFLRSSELSLGHWDEISFEDALWKVPAERMKRKRAHLVPLASQCIAILQELKLFTGESEYIFSSPRKSGGPMSDQNTSRTLNRMGYRGKQCPHGFRKNASTWMHEAGYKSAHVEFQLSHADPNHVRGTYNHAEYLKDRIPMMQAWADYLEGLKAQWPL
jgi:integrase